MASETRQGRHGGGNDMPENSGGPKPKGAEDIATDQQAGYHRGEAFAPRNAGPDVREVGDQQEARARRAARERGEDPRLATPISDTEWEKRVEAGDEWDHDRTTGGGETSGVRDAKLPESARREPDRDEGEDG